MAQIVPAKRAVIGFALSLAAGILDAFVAFVMIVAGRWMGRFMGDMPMHAFTWLIGGIVTIWGIVGLIMASGVIIGAVLIYTPGREIIGGVIVIVFSILGLFFTAGGLLLGFVLGVIGGALGLARK